MPYATVRDGQKRIFSASAHHAFTRQSGCFAVQLGQRIDSVRYPDQPNGVHGLHDWWYRCLERAGIVDNDVTSGERMHKPGNPAGQPVLDRCREPQGGAELLGLASIQTTGDIYTDWDEDSSPGVSWPPSRTTRKRALPPTANTRGKRERKSFPIADPHH